MVQFFFIFLLRVYHHLFRMLMHAPAVRWRERSCHLILEGSIPFAGLVTVDRILMELILVLTTLRSLPDEDKKQDRRKAVFASQSIKRAGVRAGPVPLQSLQLRAKAIDSLLSWYRSITSIFSSGSFFWWSSNSRHSEGVYPNRLAILSSVWPSRCRKIDRGEVPYMRFLWLPWRLTK